MPTAPRSLRTICRACPIKHSAGCLVDAQELRLHTSANQCPVLKKHIPLNELPYTKKLIQYKACCPHFSQHVPRKAASSSTINIRGERAIRPQRMQANKEYKIQEKRGILIYSMASTKTLDNTGQLNLTITLVSYIKPPSVCQTSVSFFQQFQDVAPPPAATPRLIESVGFHWIALRKRSSNLIPILLQRCINLDYAD